DNPLNLKLMEKALAKEGYKVIKASDGPTARKKAVSETPDLILLDIRMPGEDGFEVIRFLKHNSTTTSIPVIFLTGVSEIDAKLEGFELGAVDYIIKPFHPLEVIARVRLHLKLSIATNSLIATQAQKLKQITQAQTSMLITPDLEPNARFGVYYKALQEAGGDFYDILAISEDIFGYFVADFSGHDISTSYMTASLKALLKQNCSPIYQPIESVKMINDVLVEILPDGKYLTACYARLNRKSKQMTLINAGHPPVVYAPSNDTPVLLKLDGDILGIFKDVLFGQQTLSVSPGDRFYLYSDGLIESSVKKIVWTEGTNALVDACGKAKDVSIIDAPKKIMEVLGKQHDEVEDDIVVLGIEV
ncbi:MAG: fused response regulator/phosphatase, partial [Desulfobacterales bacterium]|nr:fused response regulator/phosphatase [Desulfobacterales bacterium]